MNVDPNTLIFFDSPRAWRSWLRRNHAKASVCWVGFHRKGTGVRSITYPEALDEALCYGWIDGIRKSLENGQYAIRFTPRKRNSIWSAVNIRHMARLTESGRITEAGARVFRERQKERTNRYSFERAHASLGKKGERLFRANREAWNFFQAQPPGYRKLMTFWVATAKKPETRAKRLATLIAASASGKRML